MAAPVLHLYSGPSNNSWGLFQEIGALAATKGLSFVRKSEMEEAGPGDPDGIVQGNSTDSGKVSARKLLLAPDFTDAPIPKLPAEALVDHFPASAIPEISSTRWFSTILVNAAVLGDRQIIWRAPMELDVPDLGTVMRRLYPEQRKPDPALGLYEADMPLGKRAYWHPKLFSVDTSADTRPTTDEWLDLTGRGKYIAGSPFIALLAGRWTIEWVFEVDPEGGALDLRFEWHDQEDIVTCNEAGRFVVEQEMQIDMAITPSATFTTARPHFMGRGRLLGAVVTYRGPYIAETGLETEDLDKNVG